jgi:hypothetical protein
MFAGTIPGQIVQLGKLQLLDLSNNKLTGPMPVDLANFTGMIQEQSTGLIIFILGADSAGLEESGV